MSFKIYVILFVLILFGCNNQAVESPFEVAKKYCNCIENEIKKSKDGLIDIYSCENNVLPQSRLMKIYMSFDNYSSYSKSTLDSARKFSAEVENIIDTLCINKLPPNRILKKAHIDM